MVNSEITSVGTTRGVYTAVRAAQLSGVPRTTVYYWARESRIVVPSISTERVKLWSYEDLLLLRFVAWLRAQKVSVTKVRQVVRQIRKSTFPLELRVAEGDVFEGFSTDLIIRNLLTNQTALSGEFARMLPEFHLEANEIRELGRRRLWGPDLRSPSENTRINPDVLGGEPFVHGSRVPTQSLFALTTRHLSSERIADLYELDVDLVKESLWLEASVRAGKKLPRAA